ncbi:thioesterase domain-containing protein [Nonomuraea maritima]|uniref:thioesterase domain-containing protein n=1 Tax=Nonomuraea maritima TaxID=683260 RepID=UPI0037211A8B
MSPVCGGSANGYREWVGRIPDVDIVAACLPGKASRFSSRPRRDTRRSSVNWQRAQSHISTSKSPFSGTVWGGLLAVEVARRLDARGRPTRLVVASGIPASAPQAPSRNARGRRRSSRTPGQRRLMNSGAAGSPGRPPSRL